MKRSGAAHAAFGALCVLLIAALFALGTWQVERRAWKLDLIARLDARIHAEPSPALFATRPGKDDEYRRIRATGHFLPGKDTLVQASTTLGPGWWVMTPLATKRGTVLVNRGYVADREAPAPPGGTVTVEGLLRLTEPGGGFLRSNDPVANRWYSRDVAAIASSNRVPTEPYFIDAAASPEQGQQSGQNIGKQPIGGLTVVQFVNNHLIYAITWYGLAVMTAVAYVYWMRSLRRKRPRP